MTWPALVLWALLPPLLLLRGPTLLYMTLVVNALMSLTMLPAGGVNLLPVTVFSGAMVMKIALTPGNLMRGVESALDMRRTGLLTAFTLLSAAGAILLPRLFAGLVEVVPVTGGSLDGPSLLQPRSGNYTQVAYMTLSYLTTLAISVIGSRPEVQRGYLRAVIAGALALVATGLADLVCYRLGASALLEPFRTASYELLTDVEAAGLKRVVGLTPEASAFGSLCVSSAAALLLLRPLYRPGWERRLALFALVGVALLGLLSTSSTAYAGGGMLAVVYLIDLGARAIHPNAAGRETLGLELGALAAFALIAAAALLFTPGALAPFADLLDKIVFQKSASQSYYQRSMWTEIGVGAFFDSGGLGVGVGSVRTSNWAISILSSTGFVGGILMFGFIAQKLFTSSRGEPAEAATLKNGLRLWIVPTLAMSMLGGTIPDLGVMMSVALGLLASHVPEEARSRGARLVGSQRASDARLVRGA